MYHVFSFHKTQHILTNLDEERDPEYHNEKKLLKYKQQQKWVKVPFSQSCGSEKI